MMQHYKLSMALNGDFEGRRGSAPLDTVGIVSTGLRATRTTTQNGPSEEVF